MKAGFTGGVLDAESEVVVGSNRSFIVGGDDIYPGFTAIGLGEGAWVSRFPLKGNAQLEFGFRVPNLITQRSAFKAIIQWNPKKKSGLSTDFFNKISKISRGRDKGGRTTTIKNYQRTASYWFPRKNDPVKIVFGINEDGGCAVKMKKQEMVRINKIKDRSGHIAFMFTKLVFTLHDLVIRGDLDYKWCEKEIKRLRNCLLYTSPSPRD